MTEVQNNYVYPQSGMPMDKKMLKYQVMADRASREPSPAKDEFVIQHKKNGLFERLYNGIKNLTGLGVGSKKVQAELAKVKSGEITEEQARETVANYRKSQVNGAQSFGDLASIGASGLTFFFIRNKLKMLSAEMQLNHKYYETIAQGVGEAAKSSGKGGWGKLAEQILKSGQSNKKMIGIATLAAAFAGGYAKALVMKLNSIGSKEVDKKDFNGAKTPYDKAAYKYEKKLAKKEHSRNFLSGMINGLMMPLTVIGGGLVGIPAFLLGNSLNRYFVANKTEKDKSFKGYVENLKNDSVTHAALAAAAAVPMIKKARYTAVFDKNLKAATDKLMDAALKKSEFEGKTTYQELEEILLDSPNIKNIIKDNFSVSVEERITQLTNENIFAVKFLQIGEHGELAEALRESCPRTRNDAAAQAFITEKLGAGYVFKKCLGVGTIAETYLATSPDGKEVCIKALKEGISKEKILADKQKFVELINGLEGKSKEEKEYLLRNIDDLAEGIGKEVDFQNELEAAKKLVNYTKTAKVVKPIEVKNGVYVMEKAEGISLDSLIKLNRKRQWLSYEERRLDKYKQGQLGEWEEKYIPSNMTREEYLRVNIEYVEKDINKLKDEIAKIEARTPDIGEIKMDDADAKYLFEEYMKVMVEQFYKVDKAGKTVHADIHPGNVFIDFKAMKERKGQIFTLIDTGNTIDLSAQQAMNSLRFTTYIQRADVPDIVEYMMEGANLGASGLTKEQAVEKISAELRKCFFDNETALDKVNTNSLYSMVSNIMKKYNIMPSSNQLNLDKARTSADKSFNAMMEIWFEQQGNKLEQKTSTAGQVGAGVNMLKDYLMLQRKYKNMQSAQEKRNLLQLSPQDAIKYKKNPNLLKTNDEDYLTYKLKQKIMDIPSGKD